MTEAGIVWTRPPSLLYAALDNYEEMVLRAVEALGNYYAPVLESYAKANAPWKNQTGNARQGLFGLAERGPEVVTIYLSHGVYYGIYLETRWGGRYAIIMPAIQAHLPGIQVALARLVG